jgi:hypothetical protein
MERERKSRKRQRKALKHNDSEAQRETEKYRQKEELRDRQRLTYRDIDTQTKGREGTRNALVWTIFSRFFDEK